ncbi:MAG: MBOAT family protein [Bacteroidales bacterium]|nr:MBOAT family protein [Bacteroidales bacterium]MCF8454820.1 MBOAT family protein [Bacteroidales bacterium]
MLFNSLDFAIFLPIVFILYWFVVNKSIKNQNILLLIASYVFYGWWDWRFLSLIVFSSLVDYIVGLRLSKTDVKRKRQFLLFISVFVNIGFLGFFKYYNFFLDSFVSAFSLFGHDINPHGLNIILPVGISFYTFQTLSYSIDIYKKKFAPTDDIIAFFAFVSFFPQLVAGPIERASNLLPQFLNARKYDNALFSFGVKQILWGYFLKVVVADRAGIYVDAVFNNVHNHGGLSFLAAIVFFAFQVYGDFAGYSYIAIGTAKLFGFRLMRNFNRPNFAASCGEFWKRWHISLSTWFRDYLYIPLGGNRVKKPRWLFNIFITFVISGLWHGADWTFVIWGGLNGIYLIVEILLVGKGKKGWYNVLITFILINFSRIFFRGNSLSDSLYIIKTIFTNPGKLYIGFGDDVIAPVYAVIAIILLLIVEAKKEYFNSLFTVSHNKSELVRMSAYAMLAFIILFLGVFGDNQFIYFQF